MRLRWLAFIVLYLSLFSAIFAGTGAARAAGLELTLTPVAGTGAQGGKVVFRAVLKNSGTTDLSLNAVTLLIQNSALITGDPTPFFTNFAGTLAAGATSASKPLFIVEIGATAPKQNFTGTVVILGGADANAQDTLVQTDFSVTVGDPDTAAPTTTITGGPADGDTLCAGTATFTFSGADDKTALPDLQYQWRIDGGAWQGPIPDATVTLTNLTDGSHRFEVSAIDLSGNADAAPDRRVFNVSLVAPKITGIDAAAPLAGSAAVRWYTDRPASSAVEYGITAAYGTILPNAPLVTDHRVTVSGLKPVTLYHYRVHSTDSCGREIVSADQTFTTIADTNAPQTTITGVPDNNATLCAPTAEFDWTGSDDVNQASELTYSYQIDAGVWSPYTSDTSRVYINLTEGLHTFLVRAKDGAGNVDATPAGRNIFIDTRLPATSLVQVAPRDYRAIVTWTTNKPATSQVEYGTTSAYGNVTPINAVLDGAHTVVLTGLTPLTVYHYRVKSGDGCHDTASADQTFTTTAILKPNLEVTALNFVTPSRALATLPVSFSVINNGPGDAGKTWTDSVYFSAISTLDSTAVLLGKFGANRTLGEFESYTLTQSLQMPLRPAGNYYLIVKADGDDALDENDETDNTLSMPIEFLKVSNLVASPDIQDYTIDPTVPLTGKITLGNLSPAALTGLTAAIEGASANIAVTITPPARLETMQVMEITYTVLAADESVPFNAPKIHFKSGMEEAFVTLNLTLRPRRPEIALTPASFAASMIRPISDKPEDATQLVVEGELKNLGSVAAKDLRVTVPSLPWLTLTSPAVIGDLPPGETRKISLALRPTHGMTLGAYTGNIAINGSNTSLAPAYRFNLVSEAKGSLRVKGEDEFTYFAVGTPPLVGARVTVTTQDGVQVAQGYTQSPDGIFPVDDLPEGFYNVETTADKHGTAKQTVEIVAGETRSISAFLPRQLVTYTWSVIPVDTADKYQVTLDATFETNVPAPVLTVSPQVLDLRTVSFDANRAAIVNYTLTNHGLIALNNVSLTFDQDPTYQVTPLIENLGTLGANSTVIVPVKIVASGFTPLAVSCGFTGTGVGDYDCPIGVHRKQSVKLTLYTGQCPASLTPYIGGGGGSSSGSSGATTTANSPSFTIPRPCNCEVALVGPNCACSDEVMTFTAYGSPAGGTYDWYVDGNLKQSGASAIYMTSIHFDGLKDVEIDVVYHCPDSNETRSAGKSVSVGTPKVTVLRSVSFHPGIIARPDVQGLFDAGAQLLLVDDDAHEAPCFVCNDDVCLNVTFQISPAKTQAGADWSTFPFPFNDPKYLEPGRRPDGTGDDADVDALMNSGIANIIIVKTLYYGGVKIGGRAQQPGNVMILPTNATAVAAVHEWGHNAGLPHREDSFPDCPEVNNSVMGMSQPFGAKKNEINFTERQAMANFNRPKINSQLKRDVSCFPSK